MADGTFSELYPMNDKSSQQPSLKEIFFAASEMPRGDEREAYLRNAVGNDERLLQRVERMLTDSESADSNRSIKHWRLSISPGIQAKTHPPTSRNTHRLAPTSCFID